MIILCVVLALTCVGIIVMLLLVICCRGQHTTTYAICQGCGNRFKIQSQSKKPEKQMSTGAILGILGLIFGLGGMFFCMIPVGAVLGVIGCALGIIGLCIKDKAMALPISSACFGAFIFIVSILLMVSGAFS